MARRGPNRRRWCARHQARYLTWADAQQTQLQRCPECEDEERRGEAAWAAKQARLAAQETPDE